MSQAILDSEVVAVTGELEFMVIDLDSVNVDHSYQRPLIARQVKLITSGFSPLAAGVICVGLREDGTYWVVDGQQRTKAMKQLGMIAVQAVVFLSSGPVQESQVFRLMNKHRTAIKSHALFEAALVEGLPDETAVKRIVEDMGFEVHVTSSTRPQWGQFSCVANLLSIYRRGGESVLRGAIAVVQKAWDGEPSAMRGDIVSGVATLINTVKGVNQDHLADKLSTVSPLSIIRDVRTVGPASSTTIGKKMLQIYNKGKNANSPNRLSWD